MLWSRDPEELSWFLLHFFSHIVDSVCVVVISIEIYDTKLKAH